MKKCGKVKMGVGPVKSGKTTWMNGLIERLQLANVPTLSIHPADDSRMTPNSVKSHKNEWRTSLAIKSSDLIKYIEVGMCTSEEPFKCNAVLGLLATSTCAKNNENDDTDNDTDLTSLRCCAFQHRPYRVLCIEEGQFFHDLATMCRIATEQFEMDVYVAALNCNWLREGWRPVEELLPLCTKIITFLAICHHCKNGNACFSGYTRATSNPTTRFDPGEDFFPLCRSCYVKWSGLITTPTITND